MIIFDFDDTLVHYSNFAIEAHIKTAESLGYKITTEQIKKLWGLTWNEMISSLCPSVDVELFKQQYYKKITGVQRFPIKGVLAMLNKLHNKNIILGILSFATRLQTFFLMKETRELYFYCAIYLALPKHPL
jgi:phosphoglycolate phosphatase-like HAD superfamily hydrolase